MTFFAFPAAFLAFAASFFAFNFFKKASILAFSAFSLVALSFGDRATISASAGIIAGAYESQSQFRFKVMK